MRSSKLVTKTQKTVSSDFTSRNHELLIKAGYINQEMAGVYSFLPLGLIVLKKIENIVREEMNLLDGQELILPALQPKQSWLQTKRWDNFDVLFKLKSRWSESEYALGPTHEETIFPLVRKFVSSYKDLPLSVYQFQTKFRDEKRAKSGILRGREFGMKDMYSFHETEEDLSAYYEKVKKGYINIFEKCGINPKVTKASGGGFTKKYSHEFMAISDAGEDTIINCSKCYYAENVEVSSLKEGDSCPECSEKMVQSKAIEIGNIFDLSQKFSEDFVFEYTDEKGKKKKPFSGCYGIGTTRLVGAIVELNNDEKGIIWPENVSPFKFNLIYIDSKNSEIKKISEEIYQKLIENGNSVFYDDRDGASFGVKLNDADLIGIPNQIIVSEKTVEKNCVEIIDRKTKKSKLIKIEKIKEI